MRREPSSGAMRGFTLIEVLVTSTILAILALGALPLAETSVKRTKEMQLYAALREIRTAIDAYKRAVDEGRIARRADETGYPPTLAVLADGAIDAKSTDGRRIYFLRRVPRDPFAGRDLPPAETWGKRSYESPPDAPQEGRDVYDVYSLAEGTGFNGVPYRSW